VTPHTVVVGYQRVQELCYLQGERDLNLYRRENLKSRFITSVMRACGEPISALELQIATPGLEHREQSFRVGALRVVY
jgi:hypothetical protein